MMPIPPTKKGAGENPTESRPPEIFGIPFAGIRPDQVGRINPPKGLLLRLIW
jgi:hypothetical protein